MEGVKCPHECKFPIEVDEVEIFEVIEILKATEQARISIAMVPLWEQK